MAKTNKFHQRLTSFTRSYTTTRLKIIEICTHLILTTQEVIDRKTNIYKSWP